MTVFSTTKIMLRLKIIEPSKGNPYCVAVNSVKPKVILFT